MDITVVSSCAGTFLAVAWGTYQTFSKKTWDFQLRVDAAKESLVTVIKEDRDAWHKRYDDEHVEYVTYRQARHDADQETNARVLEMSHENAELKVKTDITPLLHYQEQQTLINSKIIQSLDLIIGVLTHKRDRRNLLQQDEPLLATI